ncbi:MAG: DNA polymerase III subunit delta [Buchnera aphidicola (Chaetogeoica yunlongensis)]
MQTIHSENLFPSFFKKLSLYYLIIGDIEYLIQTSEKIILNLAKKNGFLEKLIIKFDNNTDLENILFSIQSKNFFFKKKIICIFLKKTLSIQKIQKFLFEFKKYISIDVLLIIYINKLNKYILNNIQKENLNIHGTYILCDSLNHKKLSTWINNKIQHININITNNAKIFALNNCQGNILYLNNILNITSLIWTHEKIHTKLLTYVIDDLTIFDPHQWINALLNSNLLLSLRILNRLHDLNVNPIILIRILQNNLLTILLIQREHKKNYVCILKKRNIKKNKYTSLINFSENKNFKIIHKAFKLLVSIEMKIKNNNIQLAWLQLTTLSFILCS